MTLDIAWIELQRATAPARALRGDHRRTAAEKGDRGISVMSGSDTGSASAFCRGRWHGKEAELFVKEVGMPPMEAIVANTSRNAWLMGLAAEVGVIASGKFADIVIWNSSLRGRCNRVENVTVGPDPEPGLLTRVLRLLLPER